MGNVSPHETDPRYHCIDPQTLDTSPDHPCDRRSISEQANLSVLAAAMYELAPGEQLPLSYHYHEQREELFCVQSGSLHVETPESVFVLEADEVFVAEPNSPHRPFNPLSADQSTVVLGVGAPKTDPARTYDPARE